MTEVNSTYRRTYFVDSNIWLYAFIKTWDQNKSTTAQSIIQKHEIIISTQVIKEVSVNLIKKASFSEEKIQKLTKDFYRKYNVLEISENILLKASYIREHHNFSFWDSLILASALYANVDILYSEDMQDNFIIEKTRIINPFKES